MWRKRGQESGKNLVILDAKTLWSELRRIPTRRLARKYGVSRGTLSYRLHEVDEDKYEEIIARRRTTQSQGAGVPEDTWLKLGNGSSLRAIALQNNVIPSVFHARARRDKRYRQIIEQRRDLTRQHMREAATRFMQGETIGNLSRNYHKEQPKIARAIRNIIGDKNYDEILKRRRTNPPNKIPATVIKLAARQLEQGTRITQLSRDYNIHRKTLRRRLRQLLGNKYNEITEKRRHSQELIDRIAQEFKKGKSLLKLSKNYGVPLTTLCRRLSVTLGKDYKDIIKQRLILSLRTRGADSLFEKEVEAVLKQNNIPFKKRMIIEIKGHKYHPDFVTYIIDPPLIIEATGMNREDYWVKYKTKLEHYIEETFFVLYVLPDSKSVYKKATKYIPSNFLMTLSDFRRFIPSLKKVPDEEEHYPNE